MMYLKWGLYLIPHALIMANRYWLSWVAVKFFSTEDKLQLTHGWGWFMTRDNPLTGDAGHQARITGSPYDFWNRVKWLQRNGGNSFNYMQIGVDYDKWFAFNNWMIQDTQNFWKRPDGAWQFRAKVKIPFIKRAWTPYIGWGLFGPVDNRCKFTCTILRFNKIA
ncbi:MAG: hypothetical protein M0R47_16695 [Methylobacter sp.]|uniref:DUF7338 family protein n=1 Tax=Methylobacter sp. TaxID=2051955 RepID=UPI0025D339CE|nr:hypothetical protein [Methylobacter sp.]MCK9622161.1 hypothetical protein [Methylobacter sp.]